MVVTRFLFPIFIFGVLSSLLCGCRKEKRIPLLATTAPSVNEAQELVAGAIFYSEGDAPILEKGICWSETVKTPDLNHSRKAAGSGAGSYTVALTSVKPVTTYYVRAYASNKYGTAYGSPELFRSGEPIQLASVRGLSPSEITINSISLAAYVESDLTQIRETGFCWSSSGLPDIAGPHMTAPIVGSVFSVTINGLLSNTSYSLRAYARTMAGLSYGDLIPVKTYYGSMVDQAGNSYNTVKIGNQIWMAENLRTTIYRGGQTIPNISDSYSWSVNTTGASCSFNGQAVNPRNGLYYNFAAVSNLLIAPEGWHLPTQLEFTTLINTLGGNELAGSALKSADSDQWTDGIAKMNPSGFNALPMGYRAYYGSFVNPSTTAYFVSSSYLSLSQVFCLELNQSANAAMQLWDGRSGLSVRLVKD